MKILNLVSKLISFLTKTVLKTEIKKISIYETIYRQLDTNLNKYESGSITIDEYNRRNQITMNYRLKDRLQGLIY